MKQMFSSGLFITLFTVLFLLYPFASSTQPLGSTDTFERALGLAEQGDFASARSMLGGVTGNEKSDPLCFAVQGSIELADGKTVEAATFFRAALKSDPQQLAALWGLSLCLLQRGCVYEASTFVGRAALRAPEDARIQALQAYTYLQLGQLTDAAQFGKTALEGGVKSPFLLATLAQIHYRLGYLQKSAEFGGLAAKYPGTAKGRMANPVITLPLALTITDTPDALDEKTRLTSSLTTKAPLSLPGIEVPEAQPQPEEQPRFEITAPLDGSEVQGVQQVQIAYRGRREISFVVFQVDGVLRGMTGELPFHFPWNAEAATPGAHRISARAYDKYGLLMEEHSVTVTVTTGTPATPVESSVRAQALTERMMKLTMPSPEPLSLFTSLGRWHLHLKEIPQAINALERAAALDSNNTALMQTLSGLYQDRGLHSLSPTGEITCGPITGKKRVALTFDDGPNPLYTPSIIAELARYNAHSTFFLVGKMADQYPYLALELLANGHELANHTYTHPNLTRLTTAEIIRETLQTRTLLKEITGRDTYLFRPPGGNIDSTVTRELRALDYNIIYWDINAGEYVKSPPAEQAARILSRIQDGSIVLLHNGPVDGTLSILPLLLDELSRRGYSCVTVSELMKTP